MKPSAKSSLPTAAILFSALLLILFIVHMRLAAHKWDQEQRISYLRPHIAAFVFTSDGALVYVVNYRDPRNPGVWRQQIYDENFNEKTLSVTPEAFEKDYQSKRRAITFLSKKEPDWWARNVWRYGNDLVWWNGPAGQFDFYDPQTRLRSESIGPDGTVTLAPARPEGRFRLATQPVPDGSAYLLITDDGVLRLNPNSQNPGIERLFQGRVEGWDGWHSPEPGKANEFAGLYLISGGALYQLDLQDRTTRKIPLSDPLSQAIRGSINTIVPLENGGFSITTHYPDQQWKRTLFLLSSDGSVLRRVELDLRELNSRIGGNPGSYYRVPLLIPTIVWPPPLLWLMTTADMIRSAIVSLVLTALVTWHQARTGRRGWRAFAWSAFTFLTGLAGAVSYVIAHWDKRTEVCPGCGKRRPITQDTCPHCNIPWPKPAKSGFEVLEAHDISDCRFPIAE